MEPWVCEKCGRTFKRRNQNHYCGEAPKDVEEYIANELPSHQDLLRKITLLIRTACPEAEESIRWSMPAFTWHGNTLTFSAQKSMVSLYLGESLIAGAHLDGTGITHKKDALYIPYDVPLAEEFLSRMVCAYFEDDGEK